MPIKKIAQYIEAFGGCIYYSMSNIIVYEASDGISYGFTGNEAELSDIIDRALKEKRNLLISYPRVKLIEEGWDL